MWFNGPWWVRDSRFYFMREDGSKAVTEGDLDRIVFLPMEIRGESLFDEGIEVALNGLRCEVE